MTFWPQKNFVQLKSHFSSFSQAKVYIFSLGQYFLSGKKMFCLGQKTFNILSGQKDEALDSNTDLIKDKASALKSALFSVKIV